MDCQDCDPVQGISEGTIASAEQEHIAVCEWCAEEVVALTALMYQRPLAEELAAAFAVSTPGTPTQRHCASRQLIRLSDAPLPLLADEISTGRNFARFMALEPMAASRPFPRVRLQVTVPKGQLIPIGMPVKVRYHLDEDAEVLVVHRTGKREVQLLFPHLPATDTFWQAGVASFTGTIEGRHGERQQFVILATKVRVFPDQISVAEAVLLETVYRQALEKAWALPQGQWCEAILPYTAVDMQIVEHYRWLDDLATFEAACLYEIHDKDDWAKTACGEICYRMLTALGSDQQPRDSEVRDLFVAITEKLIRYWVGHWRGTWEEHVLQDAGHEVYAQFFQTARRRPLAFINTLETMSGQPLQLPCYTALLAFLKTITFRVVFVEWREQQRAEIQTFLRCMHGKVSQLSADDKALWYTWVITHVLEEPIDQLIFAGVLAGTKPKSLIQKHLELQRAFGQDYKQLANARDAILRRVYREIKQRQPAELLPVLQRLMA